MKKKSLLIIFIVLILDRITKILVSNNIVLNKNIKIINKFFYITNVHNEGAAWSMFAGRRVLLILITVIALYIIYDNKKNFKKNNRNNLAFSLLLGGVYGNLFDRIVYGYVIDFLSFKIYNYNYPVFNISDISIFLGIALIIYAIYKGEDYEVPGSKKRRKNRQISNRNN